MTQPSDESTHWQSVNDAPFETVECSCQQSFHRHEVDSLLYMLSSVRHQASKKLIAASPSQVPQGGSSIECWNITTLTEGK
jgi:hypothetical protein